MLGLEMSGMYCSISLVAAIHQGLQIRLLVVRASGCVAAGGGTQGTRSAWDKFTASGGFNPSESYLYIYM